jgi:AcrR family transcriptional regulator
MPRRGRPTTIREADILDAARAVFLESGLGATTADIARRAGVSESIIFYRYKTKEALIAAAVAPPDPPPILHQLAKRVGQGDLAETLCEVGQGYLEILQTVLPLLMRVHSSPVKNELLRAHLKGPPPMVLRSIQMLAGYLEAEVRLGRIRAVDPEILARVLTGGVIEYVISQYMLKSAESLPLAFSTFLRGLVNILLEGALPRLRPPGDGRKRRPARRPRS